MRGERPRNTDEHGEQYEGELRSNPSERVVGTKDNFCGKGACRKLYAIVVVVKKGAKKSEKESRYLGPSHVSQGLPFHVKKVENSQSTQDLRDESIRGMDDELARCKS